jgi:hypothetical protein
VETGLKMDLHSAIGLLQNAVKWTGTIDQKHIDLTVIPADKRGLYEKALMVVQLSIKEGKISKDEFLRKLHLD